MSFRLVSCLKGLSSDWLNSLIRLAADWCCCFLIGSLSDDRFLAWLNFLQTGTLFVWFLLVPCLLRMSFDWLLVYIGGLLISSLSVEIVSWSVLCRMRRSSDVMNCADCSQPLSLCQYIEDVFCFCHRALICIFPHKWFPWLKQKIKGKGHLLNDRLWKTSKKTVRENFWIYFLLEFF